MSIKVLAAELGISVSTVSRAMNDYPDISQKTKEKVWQAAQDHGYRANASARYLVTGKSKNIGLILPLSGSHISNGFFDHLLSGATEVLLQHDYLLSAIAIPQDDHEVERHLRLIKSGILDAMILLRTRVQDPRISLLLDHQLPFVCYGRSERHKEFAWLDMDNQKALEMSVEKLIELGHKNIAFINASEKLYFAKLRRSGFEVAMQRNSLDIPLHRYSCSDLSEVSGYKIAKQMLQKDESITALICANDTLAIGAIKSCIEVNRIPGKDIAVIGYNNSPQSQFIEPALTTIQHDSAFGVGKQLGQMVLDRLNGKPMNELQRLMSPQWISRESCGAEYSLKTVV